MKRTQQDSTRQIRLSQRFTAAKSTGRKCKKPSSKTEIHESSIVLECICLQSRHSIWPNLCKTSSLYFDGTLRMTSARHNDMLLYVIN